MDVTDMIDYNMETINRHNLAQSFFQLSRVDPTEGFAFDATTVAGHTYPDNTEQSSLPADNPEDTALTLRLRLGSHLARYMRHQLEQQKGYTSTVGIAPSKLLSKLVGNTHKPRAQTTLMPLLTTSGSGSGSPISSDVGNVAMFMDAHEISRVPGIGFKVAHKLRATVLGCPTTALDANWAIASGAGASELGRVTVGAVRTHPAVNPEMLEQLLAGPGSPRGIGLHIWRLLHGVDDTEVSQARAVPRQISIEDSYIRLDTLVEVRRELEALARSLIARMRVDLLGEDEGEDRNAANSPRNGIGDEVLPHDASTRLSSTEKKAKKTKWLAYPQTLRLTTRPRLPLRPDGTRPRSFRRISHSVPLPTFVFGRHVNVAALAGRLVRDALLGMFRRLHPEKSGWDLSLMNVAVTNMSEAGGDRRTAAGRDIGGMFRRQEGVLKQWKVMDEEGEARAGEITMEDCEEADVEGGWAEDGEVQDDVERCIDCGMRMPAFAMMAHRRFHTSISVE